MGDWDGLLLGDSDGLVVTTGVGHIEYEGCKEGLFDGL